MVDSVVFKVINVSSFPAVLQWMEYAGDKNVMYQGNLFPERQDDNDNRLSIPYRLSTFADSGKVRSVFEFSYLDGESFSRLGSNHYGIPWTYDVDNDCLTFSFSIPKLLFGTNVFQLLPLPNSKHWRIGDNDPANWLEYAYKQVRLAVRKIISQITSDPRVDVYMQSVKLARIDFCYNYIFPDKQSALLYLEEIKRLNKRYVRQGSTKYNNYDTSFTHTNENRSIIVYHKGSEFEKHDRRRLIKYGTDLKPGKKRKVAGAFIESCQELADRTLRFEMKFHSAGLNYYYQTRLFRSRCPRHAFVMSEYKKIYNKYLASATYKNPVRKDSVFMAKMDELTKRETANIEYTRDYYLKNGSNPAQNQLPYPYNSKEFRLLRKEFLVSEKSDYDRMPTVDRQDFEQLKQFLAVRRSCTFAVSEIDEHFNLYTEDVYYNEDGLGTYMPYDSGSARLAAFPFDFPYFKVLYGVFWDFVQEFKINFNWGYNQFVLRLEEYNSKANDYNKRYARDISNKVLEPMRVIQLTKLKQFFHLRDTMTVDEIRKSNMFEGSSGQRTLRRYLSDCQLIGIPEKTTQEFLMHSPNMDHSVYFNWLLYHAKFK